MHTSELLPIWSLRTLQTNDCFSIEGEPVQFIRMGKTLEPPLIQDIEIITYDEIRYNETPDDYRDISWEEVVKGYQTYEPLDYYYSECLWSERLLNTSLEAGVDNLQFWPVKLFHKLSSRTWDYFIVNIKGRVTINAKELNELKVKIVRDENSLTLLLTNPIKKEWEKLNINDIFFMQQFPKFG